MDRTGSWLHDVRDLTLLYVAAGLSFAPWGAAYAVVRVWAGWQHPLATLAFLACGAVTATVVWRRVEAALGERRATPLPAHVLEVVYNSRGLTQDLTGALKNNQEYRQPESVVMWDELVAVTQTQQSEAGLAILARGQQHQATYFSAAPMPTGEHLKALGEFETAIRSSGRRG